jgi:hypothetical protein
MSITQGEAVYQAVVSVCGEQDGKYEPTKEQLTAIHESVLAMFQGGLTVHSKNPTVEQLNKYIPGLVNNWLRKDQRLNGGTTYVPKNPGSRSGSGDEAIKAMKTLLSITSDEDAKQAIQLEIDKRLSELKPKATVDVSKLPESLRHLVQQ